EGFVRQSGRICRAVAPSVWRVSSGHAPAPLLLLLGVGYPELVFWIKNESFRIQSSANSIGYLLRKSRPRQRVAFLCVRRCCLGETPPPPGALARPTSVHRQR